MNFNENFSKKQGFSNLLPLIVIAILIWFFFDNSSFTFLKPEVKLKPVTPPPSELGADEKGTIDVFESASPSVVFITNKQLRQSLFSLEVQKVQQGSGSGFIWDNDGHVVTNFHVIYQANEVEVAFQDGSVYDASLVGVDPDHDIAVLKIKAPVNKLRPLLIGSSENLKVGQKVLAIGNPFGLDSTLTTGIISALGRSIEAATGRTIHDVIQTDAAINPGNSGGPLLDSFGRLIGVNTAIVSPSGSSAGIGFAVPVDTVNYSVSKLIAYGKVDRPGIGVTLLPDYVAARLKVEGVPVFRVLPGGAAEKSGLRGITESGDEIELGDVIVEIEDKEVRKADELISMIDRFKVGDEIKIKISRDGMVETKSIRLEAIN